MHVCNYVYCTLRCFLRVVGFISYCHPDYYPADEPSYLVPDNYCGDRSIVGNAVIGAF